MLMRRRSEVETFDGCPYRYQKVYLEGQVDQGDESRRGITFHEAALEYIQRLVEAKLPADAELADQALTEGIRRQACPTHLLDEVRTIWRRHVEWFQLDLEAYFAAEEGYSGRRFRFIPDLVYVRPWEIELIDWKTYYKGLTKAQAAKEFQLKVYLLEALDIWPNFPSYRFTFVFSRLGYVVSLSFTPDEIEAWRPEVEGILQRLDDAEQANSWPAIPGSHCALCRLECPVADRPGLLPVRFVDKAQAVKGAQEILVLEQRMKALKKALKGYCTLSGDLVVNGQLFTHVQGESVRYPAAKIMDLLDDRGAEDVKAALTLSPAAVKKADPLHVLDYSDLDKLAIRESGRWTFRHKKAGAIADYGDEGDFSGEFAGVADDE